MPMRGTNVLAAGFSETLVSIYYMMSQSYHNLNSHHYESLKSYVCISHLVGINNFLKCLLCHSESQDFTVQVESSKITVHLPDMLFG
jgi:adenine C2-methylase RlmN of 23S rRNA A2503 and tRNA A37